MALLYVRGAAAAVLIDDLGFEIPQGPSWTLLASSAPGEALGNSGQFTAREIRDSKDLYDAISGGTVQWSKDGSQAEAGGDYIADFMLMQDFTDDFFDLTDGDLALPTGTSTPASGIVGQVFYDSDDDVVSIWNGNIWQDISASVDHGGLDGLSDDDHAQYLLLAGDLLRNIITGGVDFSSASGLLLPQGTDESGFVTEEGNIYWDTDDDQLYIYDGSQWLDIATIVSGVLDHNSLLNIGTNTHTQIDSHIADSTIHFTEGSIDHDNIQNNGTYSHSSIDSHIDDGTIHFTEASIDHGSIAGLGDDDHPQYAAWEQNETISGIWTFQPADDEPNLILEPRSAAPTQNLVAGALAVVGGILYAYDTGRSKWLSVDRVSYTAARKGNATNIYMRVMDGIATSETGVRMLRDGTIVGIFAQTDSSASWTFEVRRGGSVIESLVIAAATGGQDTSSVNINADVSAGDEIQFYCNGTAVPTPVGGIEVAWRI